MSGWLLIYFNALLYCLIGSSLLFIVLFSCLTESDDGGKFYIYNRWGRVGIKGADKLHGPFTSREKAIAEFEMKFYSKTRNEWCNRKNFTSYPKCYTWLEMDYDEAEKETVT